MNNIFNILPILLIISGSVTAAGGIAPDYYQYYDCKNIESKSLKEEHESAWRVGTNQHHPLLIAPDTGKSMVLWYENESDTENYGSPRIYRQALDENGNRAWGTTGNSVSDTLLSLTNAALVTDGNNGAFIVWKESPFLEACTNLSEVHPMIRMQHIDSKDKNLWGNKGLKLQIHPDYDVSSVRMISDGNGGTFISAFDKFHQEIIVHKLDAKGQKVWGEKGVSLRSPTIIKNTLEHKRHNKIVRRSSTTRIGDYKLVSNNKGGFYIAWDNDGLSLIQSISRNGDKLWESPLWIGGTENFSYTKLLAYKDELIYINTPVYRRSYYLINIARINQEGKITSHYRNTPIHERQWLGDALLSNYGDIVILWGEKTEEAFKQRYKLYVQKINTNNKRVWEYSPLQSYSYSTRNARLLSLGKKDYAVVWSDTTTPASGDKSSSFVRKKIYVQGISENGKLLKSKPVKILDSKGLYVEDSLHSVSDTNGGLFIGWTDSRRTFSKSLTQDNQDIQNPEDVLEKTDVYMQHVNANLDISWEKNGIAIGVKPNTTRGY